MVNEAGLKIVSATNTTIDGKMFIIVKDRADDFLYSGWLERINEEKEE